MHKISHAVRSVHGLDGATLLDIRQGQMFNLNPAGSRILELLKDGSSELQIVNVISREFNVVAEVAENDLREFLQTLKTYNLVEDDGDGDAV
jgi:hypothetical protein